MLCASMATPRGRSSFNYFRCSSSSSRRNSRTANKPADAVPNQREEFPSFLPLQVERLKDPAARRMATRIERLPVKVSFDDNVILSSCVKPLKRCQSKPVVLLHGFDSSCLEWRYTYPMLEDAGLETWALDNLGWGFSDLERLPPCNVASKRDHLYQFWRDYIRKPIVLVGASLGAAVAIDFAVNHPECVSKLVFVDASVLQRAQDNYQSYQDLWRTLGLNKRLLLSGEMKTGLLAASLHRCCMTRSLLPFCISFLVVAIFLTWRSLNMLPT